VRRGLVAGAILLAFAAFFELSRHTTSSTTSTSPTTIASSVTTTTSRDTTCTGADFTGAFNQGQGAAGTIFASVTLTKTSSGSCTVKGYPILTLQDNKGAVLALDQVNVDSNGAPVQFQDAKANRPAEKLTLLKGSTAKFSLAYSQVPTGNATCESVVAMSVQFSASGTSVPVIPAYPLQPCNGGRLWISPFY
jgi:hypothetical protein